MTISPSFKISVRVMGLEEIEKLKKAYSPAQVKRAANSAMASVGFAFKREVQAAGRANALGWPQLSGYTGTLNRSHGRMGFRTALVRYKRSQRNYMQGESGQQLHKMWISNRRAPMTRLLAGVRYQVNKQTSGLQMGFVEGGKGGSQRLQQLARFQAVGYKTKITARMRRLFFALHLPLMSGKTELTTPPRPLIGPIWRRHEVAMKQLFKDKFFANLERYKAGGARV
jgi:hypothetical protein